MSLLIDKNGNLQDTNQALVKGNEVANLLDQYGLNWEVKKEALFTGKGEKTKYFGTIRQDTRDLFCPVTDQYSIFQNSELAELVLRVADTLKATDTNCGMFKDGARVFMQIALADKKVAGDTVKRFANGFNSHDGSSSLRWGSGNVVVSCQNQFNPKFIKKNFATTIRHTSNMRLAIEESLRVIEQLEMEEESLFEVFAKMATVKATQKQVNETIKMITGVDVTMSEKAGKDKYSTRALNNTSELTQSILKEMSYKEKTLWGLFSGVTHFTTHKAGSDSNRAESKMIGSLLNVDQKVYNRLAELVA